MLYPASILFRCHFDQGTHVLTFTSIRIALVQSTSFFCSCCIQPWEEPVSRTPILFDIAQPSILTREITDGIEHVIDSLCMLISYAVTLVISFNSCEPSNNLGHTCIQTLRTLRQLIPQLRILIVYFQHFLTGFFR